MTKEIKLTNSEKVVSVDDEDYEWLNQYEWFADKDFYAKRKKVDSDGREWPSQIYMHRQILGLKKGNKLQVDHINQIKQDNHRLNLRTCTCAENMRNKSKLDGDFTSKYKGVLWSKDELAWRAYIMLDLKFYSLGYFNDEATAAKAYDQAARYFHKEFASLNFPEIIEDLVNLDKVINQKEYTTSKYYGVHWLNREQRWCSKIKIAGEKDKHIGKFKIELDAAVARERYILKNLDVSKYKLNFDKSFDLDGYEITERKTSSQYIGVAYLKDCNKWRASIKFKGKVHTIGQFEAEYDAAIAREKYIIENGMTGSWVRLNFEGKYER